MVRDLMREFVHLLVMGDPLGLRNVLGESGWVEDPALGHVGTDRLSELAALWRDRGGALDPRWVGATVTQERWVAEFEIDVAGPDGRVPLPVCAVGVQGAGDRLAGVRLYHSFWPLEGAHRLRKPLVDCSEPVKLPSVVERYQDALTNGDVGAITGCFTDESYAREPAGGEWTYRGLEAIGEFYAALLAGGGIDLSHCTVTDDGVRCAIEYVVLRWGRTELAPQAGVAVYERDDADRLSAARIYDDVEPPL